MFTRPGITAALAALASVAACAADPAPASRGPAVVATTSAASDTSAPRAFQLDSVVEDAGGEPDTVRLDSLRADMARLERELASAPEDERPRLLLALGRAKRLYIAPGGGRQAAWARGRPDEYLYDEVGGRYVYRGKQLQELIDRYPRHPLADDAAWQLTLLPIAGECEGFVTCHIESRWRMVSDFLARYPSSPYATRALARAIAAFEDNLKDVPDLTRSTEYYDARELSPLLAQFDSVTAGLPDSLRTRATRASARIRGRMARR